jgi:hypothetical protein
MKKSFIYFMLLSFIFCISCAINNEKNTYDLGNNFYYLADANESQILLNLKPNQRSKVGKTIIPEEVIEYNFNESFIIAKSIDHKNKTELYWIVNKDLKDSVKALNQKAFSEKLKVLRIDLKLEPRR